LRLVYEVCKVRLNGEGEAKEQAKAVLVYVMSNTLKLLHPFMPFITEEIWQTLPHDGETIMLSSWPVYDEKYDFSADAADFERIMAAIRAIRNRRAEMNVPPSKKAEVYFATKQTDLFKNAGVFFERLASASKVEVGSEWDMKGAVSIVTADATIYIPMDQLIDFEAELARLKKERENDLKVLAGINAKLNNEQFVSKAPAAIVDNQREAAAKLNEKLALLEESIKNIENRN